MSDHRDVLLRSFYPDWPTSCECCRGDWDDMPDWRQRNVLHALDDLASAGYCIVPLVGLTPERAP